MKIVIEKENIEKCDKCIFFMKDKLDKHKRYFCWCLLKLFKPQYHYKRWGNFNRPQECIERWGK